jgi:hypothetical protein
MKRTLSSLVGLSLLLGFGCGSDPGYELVYVRSSPNISAPEDRPDLPRANVMASIEAPRKTVVALQQCAERYSSTSPQTSLAVLFDIEVTAEGKPNAVRIKDSMLDGNDLERCFAGELERMSMPSAANRRNVSSPSRSVVSVVQAAAAPIALAPIVLVAGTVTILLGITIYVASEAVDAVSEAQRCRAVKEQCINHCSGPAGLPAPGGGRFRRCMHDCMQAQGCSF